MENIQNKQWNAQSNSHCPMPRALWSCDQLTPTHFPHPKPSMTAHGIEYPVLFASLGQPAWLCPLLASGEN